MMAGMASPLLSHLADALADRKVLVCVGPLLREAAGLPGPRQLLERLAEALTNGRERVLRLVADGEHARAFERAEGLLGARFAGVLQPLLDGGTRVPATARALVALAPALNHIVTTNLDTLLERAFGGELPALDDEPPDLGRRARVLFKLCGSAGRPATWRLTDRRLGDLADDRPQVASLLRSHVVLWLGYRPDDELLRDHLLELRGQKVADPDDPASMIVAADVALVPAADVEPEVRAFFGDRGVELVPLAGDYDVAAAELLRELAGEYQRRRLAVANGLIRGILLDVLPLLDEVPGAGATRRAIHDRLRAAMRALQLEGKDDPELLRNDMIEHVHRGWLALTHDDGPSARGEWEQAQALAERVLQAVPQDMEARRGLAAALTGLGVVAGRTGDHAAARDRCARAVAIAEALVQEAPGELKNRRALAGAVAKLGQVALAVDVVAARAHAERSLQLTEAWVATAPEHPHARHDLVRALFDLGDVEATAGDLARARGWFERTLPIAEARASAEPQRAGARIDLLVALDRIAQVHLQAGELVAARAVCGRVLALADGLATLDADDDAASYDLAQALYRLAEVERQAGDPAAACACLTRALPIVERLAAADPLCVPLQQSLVFGLEQLEEAASRLGDVADVRARLDRLIAEQEARDDSPGGRTVLACLTATRGRLDLGAGGDVVAGRARLARARELAEALVDARPDDAAARRVLVGVLSHLGAIELDAGDVGAARSCLERAAAVAEGLPAAGSGDQRAKLLCLVGRAACKAGELPAARAALERALELFAPSAATDGSASQSRQTLVLVLIQLGQLEVQAGAPAAAGAHYGRAFAELAALAARAPQDLDIRCELAASLNVLGDMSAAAGDAAGARAAFGRVVALRDVVAAAAPDDLQAQRDLLGALARTALLSFEAGDPAAARADVARCVPLAATLAARLPADVQLARGLATFFLLFGRAEYVAGDQVAAGAHGERAVALAERWAQAAPSDEAVFHLALCHGLVCAAAELRDERERLLAHLRRSDALLRELDARGAIAGDPVRAEVFALARQKMAELGQEA
jgi:tetratricopeptide (TPR) repeat protein